MLVDYHKEGKRAAFALVAQKGVSPFIPVDFTHRELLAIPEEERWIVSVPYPS
jgi:hypothetical protein